MADKCPHCGKTTDSRNTMHHQRACSKIHNFINTLEDYELSVKEAAAALGYKSASGTMYTKIRLAFSRLGIKPVIKGIGRPPLTGERVLPPPPSPQPNDKDCKCGFMIINGKCMNCEFYKKLKCKVHRLINCEVCHV